MKVMTIAIIKVEIMIVFSEEASLHIVVSHKKHFPFVVTVGSFLSRSHAFIPPPFIAHPLSIINRGFFRSKNVFKIPFKSKFI